MNKKNLSETEIRTRFITPAIIDAGWDKTFHFREELSTSKFKKELSIYTAGKIVVKGNKTKRDEPKKFDYILFYKPHLPIAIVEAKDNKHSIGEGLQQALNYSDIIKDTTNLDIPFIYSSNGDGFIEHDRTTAKERLLMLNEFPTPNELWERYKQYKGIDTEKKEEVSLIPYYTDDPKRRPRYYQRVAVNKTIEAVVNQNRKRVLLVMATGTGKTYTAFQIIYKLHKAKFAKKILFLADRNILVDQTKTGDFKHFGETMTKITNRTITKGYEIYLGIYQALTGEGDKNIYKQFSKDFFDLIVIDEAHRGSAREDSQWRAILDYFDNAVHIGLTATPKETKEVSNIDYFGEPIYTYSLKQGIDDGFLAPYKVVRFSFDKDVEGWRPYEGQTDKFGNVIDDRIYNTKDYDKNIILEKRTKLVAKHITKYLNNTDRYSKTIVFCVDTEHAERMRSALVNENNDIVKNNSKYIVRITGNDDIGKMELDNFIHPEKMPIIATTSKLLTTGVDTKTAKIIVLDTNINSMIEFKQIIGRGTRVEEDFDKTFFTILDFRNASRKFADKDFDGEPIKIIETDGETETETEEDGDTTENGTTVNEPTPPYGGDESEPQTKYYIEDTEVKVLNKTVSYLNSEGKLITQSLEDYTKSNILKKYATLNDFLNSWNSVDKKKKLIEELENEGVLFEELEKIVGKDFDAFDLILHIAFDKPPLTRSQRAKNVIKRDYFSKYGDVAKRVLEKIIDKYKDKGIMEVEDIAILSIPEFEEFGTSLEIIKHFGNKKKYLSAIREIEDILYEAA
ncbi:MAG: DEAD/DEAH box helicase family protein [Campylobacterota bacterium]|nr:DEAD/DEAH box helicase family protein [Campylobacterota bacterium]